MAGAIAVAAWLPSCGLHDSVAENVEGSSARNFDGMCLDDLEALEGDFFEELGQGFGLAFRKSADSDFFLLTRFENDARGCVHDGVRIVASLALPKVEDDEWFAVSFDCSAATGSVKEREPVIGIFDKTNDNVLPNPALRAWVIDLGARRFRPVPNVVCSSFT